MDIKAMFGCKPRTLGAGLNRIKKQFGVKGENTSTVLGTRSYPCYNNKHTLNIRTDGKPFDSCLCLEVDRYKEPQDKSLLGKISDITKSYTRRQLYQDGDIGSYNEHYTTVDTFANGSDLLDKKDVNKLSNTSIENCYSIVNTEEYDITLTDNGTFNELKAISSTSTEQ